MIAWLFRNMGDDALNRWGRWASTYCVGASLLALVAQIVVIAARLVGRPFVGDTAQLVAQIAWVPFLLPAMAFWGERLRRDFAHHAERTAEHDKLWADLTDKARQLLNDTPPHGSA